MGSLESKTTGSGERERLRVTFDSAAAQYQQARPEYPDALYEELIRLTGLRRGQTRLLEVGCATGKATLPLARRGLADHLPGDRRRAGRRGPAQPRRVPGRRGGASTSFETWRPPRPRAFDLVFAATAWHWIDPAVRYRRGLGAAAARRPPGLLGASGTCSPTGGDPFFREIQDVYDEIGEGLPPGSALQAAGGAAGPPGRDRGQRAVQDVVVRRFDWEIQLRRRRVHPAAGHVLRATSRWRHGSGSGSTARSAAAWPAAPTAGCAGTGDRCCTWPAAATTPARG